MPESWKQVLGEPGSVTMSVHDETPHCLWGGGPSFDRMYTTPKLDWTLESRAQEQRLEVPVLETVVEVAP